MKISKVIKHEDLLDALGTYISAAVGAFSLAFADTFWFNAVEAEVYALSTFFIAFAVWLIMVWHDEADQPGSERYIIFMFYLFGLATGVHLLSLIALIPIVMIIMFRKYLTDEEELKKTGYILIGHGLVVLLIAMGIWYSHGESTPPSPESFGEFDFQFIAITIVVSAFVMGAFWRKIFSLNSFYVPMMIGGVPW